jgi:hypothetical protein
MPGPHLVVVRYSPEQPIDQEWVYNDADIDASKVVWARDMGPVRNHALRMYFHDRHAWLLEPDPYPGKLTPYQDSE